jgi:hypothetical protein
MAAFKLPGGQNRIPRANFFAFASKHGIPVRSNTPK